MKSMDVIRIRGLEITATHGVHKEEKINAQPFVFDADIRTDFKRAADNDDLALTVNYSAVCDLIAEITQGNAFDLIETLAYACACGIIDNFPADGVDLTVYKPHAPVKHKFENVGVSVSLKRVRAYLSLGSSLGDKKAYLDTAIELLKKTQGIKVTNVSSYIQTPPVGGVAKNTFVNCAVEIDTYLAPDALLERIHKIESACGRVRDVHWGDRTLDIDIIFYGREIIEEDYLVVPHPEYHKRSFVLAPMCEIAPDFVCPVFHKKMKNFFKNNS